MVKLILNYRQKYESRLKFLIFDIFLLNIHHDKHFFNDNVERKSHYGTFVS